MHRDRSRALLGAAALLAACGGSTGKAPAPRTMSAPPAPSALRAPAEFATIADRDERSRAIFLEATRVMLHPRCINCHPAGDTPTQGESLRTHDPPVVRGASDDGVPGLACGSCHGDRNVELARVPGAPNWHLAPRAMAWVHRTPGALCAQIKDPARNGNKTLGQIVEHAAHDPLVAWGWSPGHDRPPAPGTQAQFGALMAAWVQDGAACPREEAQR